MNISLKRKLKTLLPGWLIRSVAALRRSRKLLALPGFFSDYFRFRCLARKCGRKLPVKFKDLFPIFGEATSVTDFDHHYIYHPAWAARIVRQINPPVHSDISSTLHFCSTLSAFIPVNFYDYRPAPLELSNLRCDRADLTSLPFRDGELVSLSCMHTIEHIGLGRYGDPLDPDGDLKAMGELQRVVARGGSLLFVVPLGREKTMFNAHRIYSYQSILEYFSAMQLREFSLITDAGSGRDFITNATRADADQQVYGCGCFWFVKN